MRVCLKMLINAVYKHQYLFAQIINKREDWLSKVVNGKIDPSKSDKQLIAAKLDIADIEGLFIDKKFSDLKTQNKPMKRDYDTQQ